MSGTSWTVLILWFPAAFLVDSLIAKNLILTLVKWRNWMNSSTLFLPYKLIRFTSISSIDPFMWVPTHPREEHRSWYQLILKILFTSLIHQFGPAYLHRVYIVSLEWTITCIQFLRELRWIPNPLKNSGNREREARRQTGHPHCMQIKKNLRNHTGNILKLTGLSNMDLSITTILKKTLGCTRVILRRDSLRECKTLFVPRTEYSLRNYVDHMFYLFEFEENKKYLESICFLKTDWL